VGNHQRADSGYRERELNQGQIESRINRVRQLLGPSKSDASSKVQVIVSDGTQSGDLVRFDYDDLQYDVIVPDGVFAGMQFKADLSLPAYETKFFDDMSIDTRSPNSLLYHQPQSVTDSDSLALHQAIWELQHPRNCTASRLLILSEYHRAGIGSTLHVRLRA